jgi:hypothetical protein
VAGNGSADYIAISRWTATCRRYPRPKAVVVKEVARYSDLKNPILVTSIAARTIAT